MKEFLLENFNSILDMFKNYYGDFKYFIAFVFALLVNIVLIKKETKEARTIVVYLPILILLILFNPILYWFEKPFAGDGGVYWRFFWLVPLAPTIAYAIVNLVNLKDNKIFKWILGIVCAGIIIFKGNYMYQIHNFQTVGNIYKCPDDIFYCIKVMSEQEIENKKAMIPIAVVPWVRQYDANISIEYDRSPSGSYGGYIADYEKGIVQKNMQKLLDDGCNFFVIYRGVNCDINFEDYGCVKIGENDNYLVYMLEK